MLKKLANGTRASFAYDDASNLTRLANLKSDGTTISSFDYAYDNAGNRTAVLEADGSRVTWSYDPTYQLTGEHRTGSSAYRNTFTYDPAGNRTLKNETGQRTTYAYDAANQLKTSLDSLGTTTYMFDADGNQQIVQPPTGNRTTTTWDYENRTTLVHLAGGLRNTMAYEPDGLRINLEDSTGMRKFIWDDQNYLAETDASDLTQVVYTNEPAYYGNLISQRRGATTNWYHFDAIGSTRELTLASQAVSDTYLYDAWGNVVVSTGTTTNSFQLVGRLGYILDIDTKDCYVRSRSYSPMLARWTSLDSAEFVDGPNRYLYIVGNPGNSVDPSGQVRVSLDKDGKIDPSCPQPGVDGECHWLFALHRGAPCNGFLVQQVTVRCEVKECDGRLRYRDNYRYFEAWPVNEGERTPIYTAEQRARRKREGETFTDRARFPPIDCTYGRYDQDGWIRFYCNAEVGVDAKKTAPDRRIKGWTQYNAQPHPQYGTNCTTSPGFLTSTDRYPTFWADGEGSEALNAGITEAYRAMILQWTCCPDRCIPCGEGSVGASVECLPGNAATN